MVFVVFKYDDPIDDIEFVKNKIVDSIIAFNEP